MYIYNCLTLESAWLKMVAAANLLQKTQHCLYFSQFDRYSDKIFVVAEAYPQHILRVLTKCARSRLKMLSLPFRVNPVGLLAKYLTNHRMDFIETLRK